MKKKLNLYLAKVSTDMIIVAKNAEEASKTASMYAADEIKDYCDVDLSHITEENDIPRNWKTLYPYISNKCIGVQQKCLDLFRSKLIQKRQDEKQQDNDLEEEKQEEVKEIKSPKKSDLPPLRF